MTVEFPVETWMTIVSTMAALRPNVSASPTASIASTTETPISPPIPQSSSESAVEPTTASLSPDQTSSAPTSSTSISHSTVPVAPTMHSPSSTGKTVPTTTGSSTSLSMSSTSAATPKASVILAHSPGAFGDNKWLIAIIVLTVTVAALLCIALAWRLRSRRNAQYAWRQTLGKLYYRLSASARCLHPFLW